MFLGYIYQFELFQSLLKLIFFIASCPHLTNIPNGVIISGERTHGSFIQFVCNDGYKLIGESSVSCNDGSWSEKKPHCLGLY